MTDATLALYLSTFACILATLSVIVELIEYHLLRKTLRELLDPVRLGQIIVSSIEAFLIRLKEQGKTLMGEVADSATSAALDKGLAFLPKKFREAIKGISALTHRPSTEEAKQAAPKQQEEYFH